MKKVKQKHLTVAMIFKYFNKNKNNNKITGRKVQFIAINSILALPRIIKDK
ncbi:hypothetical protein [Pedobacter sp. Leaf194]|uniref:hypothetical protein n=1 Tax=Pedobacter sp. Leaf194 TaxID=1736297 RepID=UPI000AB22CCE|nr:hypothetical protein [Pedobacter sp. Leaf194]